ncbi:MAG: CPBP family intramembrane glutamic endopeptidase [Pseudomonadota bacterium]
MIRLLTAGFIGALLLASALRAAEGGDSALTAYAVYATELYIGATIIAAIALGACGLRLDRVGFAGGLKLEHAALALFGVAALQGGHLAIDFLLTDVFGVARDLSRFEAVATSPAALFSALALSWTFAAFGEEIAYRVVLLRGLAASLGGGAGASAAALVLQAALFGLAHAYQGPAGVAGSAFSGLVFGALVLAARGSVWPAVLAHGLNNTIGLVALYLER